MHPQRPPHAAARWFWTFATGHLIVWTLVPALTQVNAPLDTVEMLCWGHEWQWGYFNHPPLPAWSAEVFAVVFGDPVWPTYLLSQICIVGCFWAAWRLAREELSPWQSLVAAIVLETSVYYSFTTPEFNHNIMAKVVWALFALYLYSSMKRGRMIDWATAGVFLGSAFLCKYDAVLLVISVLFFSMASSRARAFWRTPGPYVMSGIALLLLGPHLRWLVANDFITIRYTLARFSGDPSWLAHVRFPVEFLGAQLVSVGLVFLVFTIPSGWRWRVRPVDGEKIFHRVFVTYVLLGPLALALLFSACTGVHIRSMWGASMFTFLGVALFSWFEAVPGKAFVRRAVLSSIAIGMGFAIGLGGRNLLGGSLRDRPLRVDFPGKKLAKQVEKIWRDRETKPLKQVGGNAWLAGNISVYHPSRPSVFVELDEKLSPWVDEGAWLRDGGVVVWDEEQSGAHYVQKVREMWPSADILSPLKLGWKKMPRRSPLSIGVAVIPAQSAHSAVIDRKPSEPFRRECPGAESFLDITERSSNPSVSSLGSGPGRCKCWMSGARRSFHPAKVLLGDTLRW